MPLLSPSSTLSYCRVMKVTKLMNTSVSSKTVCRTLWCSVSRLLGRSSFLRFNKVYWWYMSWFVGANLLNLMNYSLQILEKAFWDLTYHWRLSMSLLKCATSFVCLTVSGSVPLESLSLSDSILVIKIVCSNLVCNATVYKSSVWLSCLDLVIDTIACPLVYLLTGKLCSCCDYMVH